MFRLILIATLVYFAYKILRGWAAKGRKISVAPVAPPAEDLVYDTECGLYVPISRAHIWEHEERRLYFCSRQCLERYKIRVLGKG